MCAMDDSYSISNHSNGCSYASTLLTTYFVRVNYYFRRVESQSYHFIIYIVLDNDRLLALSIVYTPGT